MDVFIIFVIIVFGVLSIILFFKVWGMSNNTAKIWKSISQKQQHKYLDEAEIELEKGNKAMAEELRSAAAYLREGSHDREHEILNARYRKIREKIGK